VHIFNRFIAGRTHDREPSKRLEACHSARLGDALQAAAAEQNRSMPEVLRDALEGCLRAWRPLTQAT
jgi:hypothetical protein